MIVGIVFPILPSEMVALDRMGVPNVQFRLGIGPREPHSGIIHMNARSGT